MKDILIIGAGQLGSRHLQGTIRSHLPLNVVVVDPNINSLELAEHRASEVVVGNKNTIVKYRKSLQENMSYDLCIIATTANVRFKVFLELINKCTVKNIIFEKVLFQKESEYIDTENLLAEKQINAWVNCPRRMNPVYQKLKLTLMNEEKLFMKVTGNNWGLACNGIHFLDLFSFFTGNSDITVDNSLLDPHIIASKRNGFYEVNGTLKGCDKDYNEFEITCFNRIPLHIEVELITPSYQILIKESEEKLIMTYKEQRVEESYKPLFQSQLTSINIEEIVEQGKSSLTCFSDSKNIHLQFINSLKHHIETSLKKTLASCPIT